MYTLENDPTIRQLTVKDGVVTDQHGVALSPQETAGFNHILRPARFRFNAQMFVDLTGTPQHFWETLSDQEKKELLAKIDPELQRIVKKSKIYREAKLKKVYKRRSARAVNSRNRKIAEAESTTTQNG
jgi:hypothetical protein